MEKRDTGALGEGQDLGHACIWKYMKVIKLHRSALERELSRTGVYRSQHQILMYIAENPDASQKDVARRHNVSTATIAVSMKKLEKGGYIRREADEKDNRCNQIRLTEKGWETVEVSRRIFGQIEERMFAGFTREDFSRMNGCLDRMSANLEAFLEEQETEREE